MVRIAARGVDGPAGGRFRSSMIIRVSPAHDAGGIGRDGVVALSGAARLSGALPEPKPGMGRELAGVVRTLTVFSV